MSNSQIAKLYDLIGQLLLWIADVTMVITKLEFDNPQTGVNVATIITQLHMVCNQKEATTISGD
jgi:hypothetical protein